MSASGPSGPLVSMKIDIVVTDVVMTLLVPAESVM